MMRPLRPTLLFGAIALGQQEDMWLRLRLGQICLRQTSHILITLSEIPQKIGGEEYA